MKQILFAFSALLFCFQLFPQVNRGVATRTAHETVFQQKIDKEFMIMHISGAFENKKNTNAIVASMADFYELPDFRANWKYSEWTTITRVENQLMAEVRVKPTGLALPKRKSSLDITSFLIPDRMNFRLQLRDNTGEVLYEEILLDMDVSAVGSSEDYTEVISRQIPEEFNTEEYLQRGLSVKVVEIVSPRPALLFSHSDSKREEYEHYLSLLMEYLRDAALVKEELQKIENINVDDLETLPEKHSEMEVAKARIDSIREKEYGEKINRIQGSADLANLNKNIQAFDHFYHERKRAVQETLKNLDDAYYNRGMDFLRKRDIVQALAMFNRAISINPAHVGANYQIAKTDFEQARYEDALERANHILSSMNPDAHQRQEVRKLIFDIHEIQAMSVNLMIQQSLQSRDFDAAEFYLKEAVKLLRNNPAQNININIEEHKAALLSAYLTEGMKYLSGREYERAIEFFERAQVARTTYGIDSRQDIQLMMMQAREGIVIGMLDDAQGLLDRRNYRQALELISRASGYINSQGLSGQVAGKLAITADNYFRDILQQIDNANRGGKYSAALEMISDARYLCDNFAIRCDKAIIEQRERESRQSIFLSLTAEAERALNRGDLGLAKSKVGEAVKYRETWSQYIPSGFEAEQVNAKIRHKEYQNAIDSGNMLLNRKDYSQALAHFDEASMLEFQGGFPVDPKLPELRKLTAQLYMLMEITRLEQAVGESMLMTSKDKLLELMTMRTKYDLQNNQEIESRLQALQSRMISAACRQQQATYDDYFDKAYKLATEKRFVSAGKSLKNAIAAAAQNPECHISDTSAARYLVQLTPAIEYQIRITEANRLLDEYRNADALAAYIAAEELYNRGNVRVYGLDHEPLKQFVLRQNLNFILTAAYYFKEEDKPMESLELIKELAKRGYPPDQTRLLQEQIGFGLGAADKAKFPASSWRVTVLEYTGGSKFFKYLRKAYKKGWKSIKQ